MFSALLTKARRIGKYGQFVVTAFTGVIDDKRSLVGILGK